MAPICALLLFTASHDLTGRAQSVLERVIGNGADGRPIYLTQHDASGLLAMARAAGIRIGIELPADPTLLPQFRTSLVSGFTVAEALKR